MTYCHEHSQNTQKGFFTFVPFAPFCGYPRSFCLFPTLRNSGQIQGQIERLNLKNILPLKFTKYAKGFIFVSFVPFCGYSKFLFVSNPQKFRQIQSKIKRQIPKKILPLKFTKFAKRFYFCVFCALLWLFKKITRFFNRPYHIHG